jgi:hypothetical protein
MTAFADINALAPTAGAKSNAQASRGADYAGLVQVATMTALDLKRLMAQINALTPGGDANLAALATIIAEIA